MKAPFAWKASGRACRWSSSTRPPSGRSGRSSTTARSTTCSRSRRDVALRIAAALNATLGPEERTRVARPPTTNAEAYELYLRSQELSAGERQQNLRAIELLKKIVSLDPTFAVAHARLAYRTCFLGVLRRSEIRRQEHRDRAACHRAGPQLAPAHMALASAYGQKGWASTVASGIPESAGARSRWHCRWSRREHRRPGVGGARPPRRCHRLVTPSPADTAGPAGEHLPHRVAAPVPP